MAAWIDKLKTYGSRLKPYERHLSALGMIGGFVFDFCAYGRVDHDATQTILIVYLATAALTILLLQYLEARPEWTGKLVVRLRGLMPAATQFALGTLWSAFLVFYARGGSVASSWPFLCVLLAIFVGNEIFASYHARLIFTAVLFAFALLSYAIFMVPVFTHTIGMWTFVLSGAAAGLVFLLFLRLLSALAHERWLSARLPILAGSVGVFAAVYGLYFLSVLPPLPLAMQKSGAYTSVKRVGRIFYATGEHQPWQTWIGADPVVHLQKSEKVYAFSAVFAPTRLSTTIRHVWQRYDDKTNEWRTVQTKLYTINGGREKGFRGYTVKSNPAPGRWRVDVQTVDERLIGRIVFRVVRSEPTEAMQTTVIQ